MRQLCLISPLALLVELQTLLLRSKSTRGFQGADRRRSTVAYSCTGLRKQWAEAAERANSSQSAAPQSQQPASCSRSASEEVQSVSSSRSVGSTTANRQLTSQQLPCQQTPSPIMSAKPEEVEPAIDPETPAEADVKEEVADVPATEGPGATYYTPMHPKGIKDTSSDFQVTIPRWPSPLPRPPCSPVLTRSASPTMAGWPASLQSLRQLLLRRLHLGLLHLVHDPHSVRCQRLGRHMLA